MMDINEIKSIIPHRYPFLLVDKIVGVTWSPKLSGLKMLPPTNLFSRGIFLSFQ